MTGAEQPQALQDWCEKTWPDLYRFIYHHVQNRQEAEDLTQETFSRTLAVISPTGGSPPLNYVKTAALNLIRDRWRRRRARGIQVPLEESLLTHDRETDDAVDRAWIAGLLAHLSEEHRTVLRLRIVEGCSRAETARRMGRSEDAVRGLQYRAVRALRDLMRRYLEEEKR